MRQLPAPRSTSVVVLKRVNSLEEELRVLISLSTTNETICLVVEAGRLTSLSAAFSDEATALTVITRQGFFEVLRGTSLLGFASTLSVQHLERHRGEATSAGVLVATKTATKIRLPGGHAVQLVTEAQWVTASSKWVPEESDFWKMMKQEDIAGSHYYCETLDLTRPFPSGKPPEDADLEWVWNHWLTKSFRRLDITCYPRLLQGAAECSEHVDVSGDRFTVATLSRRSRRHPGTRYNARGLNEYAGPGNEIEAELIVWKKAGKEAGANDNKNTTSIRWCRHFWRRGTVPIWWGVQIQPLNKGLHAEVYVKDQRTYVGSTTYFLSLLRRVAEERGLELMELIAANDASDAVTCINLLHCNPKKAAELMLSSHFQEGVRHVKDRLGQLGASRAVGSVAAATGGVSSPSLSPHPSPLLRLMNFDWHGTMGSLTEEKGVEAFWHVMEQPIKAVNFAAGTMFPGGAVSNSEDAQSVQKDVTSWGQHWKMVWDKRQRAVLRFNCADSLDRTNAASCFAVLAVLQQMLAYLGIELDMVHQSSASWRATLPPGWEVRDHGGRQLYIDHNTKKTQWAHPGCPEPSGPVLDWKFFSYSLTDVQTRLNPIVIHEYVAMFRRHGDVHSELYTGSRAMHSHILGIVKGEDLRTYGSASSSVGKLQNLKVAVQRRWNNTVTDASRQEAIELFVGLHLVDGDDEDRDPVYEARPSDTSIYVLEDRESKEITHLGAEIEGLHLTKQDGKLVCQADDDDDDVEDAGEAVLPRVGRSEEEPPLLDIL